MTIWQRILRVIIFILCLPLFVLYGIFYVIGLLFVPFDFIKYRKSAYYKDLKKRYKLFMTRKTAFRVYNQRVKDGLPLEYHENGDYEYFTHNGTVLHLSSFEDVFEEEGKWYQAIPGDKQLLTEELARLLQNVKEEHKALPAKFLCFENDFQHERYIIAQDCPHILYAHSTRELKLVLDKIKNI